MGRKMSRKRRASSERESEVESDRETNSRHESRPKRRHESSSNEKASKKMQNSVADAVPADPVAKKVTKPKSFLDTITSDEAEQYIKSIWEGKFKNRAHNDYTPPREFHQLHFNFNNGGLMNFADVEKAIPKIKNMIKICPKLPKMSELVEL
ncbi:hypothetical protein Ddc_15874 [Ditylenchus destructor]|nr:hypothetical protein Ddc_15874 [Ditylenchus destructor]